MCGNFGCQEGWVIFGCGNFGCQEGWVIFGTIDVWIGNYSGNFSVSFSITAAPKFWRIAKRMAVDFDFNQRAEYTGNIFNASVVQVMNLLDMQWYLAIGNMRWSRSWITRINAVCNIQYYA